MNRLKYLSQIEHEEYDVCIIGGGATGVGCALDATLRGLKTILVEKNDFASATSSKSTKLFHGGVRYLEQAVKKLDMEQFRMVYKGLQERKTLIQNAPYLAHPLPLLTPCSTLFEGLYYTIGLKIYDLLAGKTNLAPSDWLSKADALKRIPELNPKKLASAVLYYDGQFDDARYTLSIVKTADEQGAILLNHIDVLGFEKNETGQLKALKVRDAIKKDEFTIKSKAFINATGPFSDHIRQMATPSVSPRMRVSKGVHILLPRDVISPDTAILIPKTEDGRVIFMIPWQGRLLVGTTDDECELTEKEITVDKNDVAYLLKYANLYLNKTITLDQVKSGFGGLRPLLQADADADTKSLVRDHEVELDKKSGLISILGGKWTTYRLMAKDTIDKTEEILRGSVSECKTDKQLLVGTEGWSPDFHLDLVKRFKVPEYVAKRLSYKYGTDAEKILILIWKDGSLRVPIIEGSAILRAEMVYCAIYEMGLTLKDIFARRLGMELTDWDRTLEAIPVAANLLQEAFWWTEEEKERQITEYRNEIIAFKANIGLETKVEDVETEDVDN
jgi:glycerol-3-phosphate dehydrogenase